MSNQTKPPPTQQGHAKEPKLLDQLSDAIRVKHLSLSTEKQYCKWVYRYCKYHHFRHPREMGAKEITQYLSHLATDGNVAASTQNQALCAIIFFYKHVLKAEPETLDDMVWAKRPETIPVVLSKAEVLRVIEAIPDKFHQMLVQMLYGTGMRLKELIRLRIKDVDFERNQITIRRGKGDKDRMAILPTCVRERLQKQIRHAIAIHDHDLKDGKGEVYMPNALFEKYPNAAKERGWQYVFPSDKLSKDPRSNRVSRHHLFPSVLRHALKAAKQKTGILKPVYAHGLRHAFATHLLEDGHDIRTIQELLGHVSVETTMVYTHVLNSGPSGVRSPVDRLMPHASDPPPVNSPQARELAKDKQLSNSRSATDVPPLREALGIALKSLGHAIKHFFYS